MNLLKDRLKGRRLILASASPRRRQLLAEAGLPFAVAAPYEVDEVWPEGIPAAEVAEYLAALKSDGYPERLNEGDILLTADTTVVLGDTVLGKPRDAEEAARMLAALSGRSHTVITGVTLRGREKGAETGAETVAEIEAGNGAPYEWRETFAARSEVWFRALTAAEIAHYVEAHRPMDKAGAYGIQEWIGLVGVERIEGSFHNVMGLPVQMVYTKLNEILSR